MSQGCGKKVKFPRDTGAHRFSDLEWWYCFAILDGDRGGKYAFMSSFFRAGIIPLLKGHYLLSSVIDLNQKKRSDISLLDKNLIFNINLMLIPYILLYYPWKSNPREIIKQHIRSGIRPPHNIMETSCIINDPLSLSYGDSCLEFSKGGKGQFSICIKGGNMAAELEYTPSKPAALLGGDGKPGGLYYYSCTDNEVQGKLGMGSLEDVHGRGWFDHQWGWGSGLLRKTGWNWFGIQLDDKRELVINEFLSFKTGETFSQMANIIDIDGRLKHTKVVYIKNKNTWQSPVTGAVYPQEWDISIPEFSMVINIKSEFPEQEIQITFPLKGIWEGPCIVSGFETLSSGSIKPIGGRGFMELL